MGYINEQKLNKINLVTSAWGYAIEVGDLLYSVLTNYTKSYLNCFSTNAKEAHIKNIRPTYGYLFMQYTLVRPMVKPDLIPLFDKSIVEVREKMEAYLTALLDGTKEPDYEVLDEFNSIHNDLMIVMQKAGLLYAAKRFIPDHKRKREAYSI